jgi:uncharacterized protein (TIGR02246 family)
MSNRRRVIVVAFLMLGLSGPFNTGASAVTTDAARTQSELLGILDDEGSAWAKGDADAFAAHVREDVVFTNVVGMFSVGKVSFVGQHKAIFTTIYQGSVMRQFVQNIRFLQSDTAIVDTIAKLSGFHELPTGAAAVDGTLYTRLEQVMVRENGTWQVASFHNVPIQPKFVDQSVRSLTAAGGH